MPYPEMELLSQSGFEQRVCESYAGQLYLCKHRNKIYQMLYGSTGQPASGSIRELETVNMLSEGVASMKWASKQFRFGEFDSPAMDILSARLRNNYWRAQAMAYRPFIQRVLQLGEAKTPTEAQLGTESLLVEYARTGIRALIQSTRALHGLAINEWPVMTNVFGIAHG
jgi:hypothetical protein